MKKKVVLEFSRPIEITKLNSPIKLTPHDDEKVAIAKRLGLVSLDQLEANLILKQGQGNLIIVKGKITAKVTQSCVVTLEPVPAAIEAEFSETFSENAQLPDEFDPMDDSDAPEPVENGKIDLGELVVQHLSLSLEPYPRREGAEFQGYDK